MSIKKLSQIARKLLPGWLFKYIRSIGTAILTPILFSYRTGHFKSSLQNKPIDRNKNSIPWYSYPIVEFLMNKNFKDKIILEWGAGHSTLWWAKHAKKVITFESDVTWYEYIYKLCPSNVSLFLISDNINDAKEYLGKQHFDIIIVDGFSRFECSSLSIDFLAKDGCIILDNSEGFWGEEGEFPILDLFRKKEFKRIDFFGYSAGLVQPQCTSLFFHTDCFLLSGVENPKIKFA